MFLIFVFLDIHGGNNVTNAGWGLCFILTKYCSLSSPPPPRLLPPKPTAIRNCNNKSDVGGFFHADINIAFKHQSVLHRITHTLGLHFGTHCTLSSTSQPTAS